jgi:hypothetical protein
MAILITELSVFPISPTPLNKVFPKKITFYCHSGLDPESRRRPRESGNLWNHWIPAFAGMTHWLSSCLRGIPTRGMKVYKVYEDGGGFPLTLFGREENPPRIERFFVYAFAALG